MNKIERYRTAITTVILSGSLEMDEKIEVLKVLFKDLELAEMAGY